MKHLPETLSAEAVATFKELMGDPKMEDVCETLDPDVISVSYEPGIRGISAGGWKFFFKLLEDGTIEVHERETGARWITTTPKRAVSLVFNVLVLSVTDRKMYRTLLDDLDRIAFGFDYEAGEFGLNKRRVHIGTSLDLSASIWIEPEDYSDPTDNEPVNIAHVGRSGRLKLRNNFKIGVTDLTGVEVDKDGLTFEDAVKAASVVFAELVKAGFSDPSAP